MSNHLIIGLGGTGGKIIRAFRKTIFQEFRQTEPQGVNVGYLYIDSDDGMMAPDDPSWKILGRLVQLGKNQQVCIQGANLQQYLDNINAYPGIKPWIGDQEQWNDILRSFVGVAILGGQKRRLGRFLFACNVDKFINQLTLQVSELQRSSQQSNVTFHVCSGLAGGTGSGIIIDVLAQIRQHFPYKDSNSDYTIIVYTLLPEINPKPGWDTGNYHANGYAALVELNALSAGAFRPYEISAGGRINSSSVMFNGLYLFTNQNERGTVLDVEEEVPDMVADFLHQKIVAVGEIAWEDLRRAENMENGDSTPETAPIVGSQIPQRAKRFLTFGIKRIAIPEEEIKEYLTYQFARQVVLQIKFNNWEDTNGFVERTQNKDFHAFVAEKATQDNWLLSDDHLCLSKAILPQDIEKNWNTIDEDWQTVVPNFTSLVRSKPKKIWLQELPKLFATRFDQHFRSGARGEVGGVQKFYELKLNALTPMAKEIRQRVENTIFSDWKNGRRSINEIVALNDALIESLDKRHKEIEAKIIQREKQKNFAGGKIEEVAQQWAKTWLFGKENMLDQQALNLRDFYIARTWIEALGFSEKLLDALLIEFRRFQVELERCMNTVSKAVEEFDTLLAQRINDEGQADITKQVVRFYDQQEVKTVAHQLVSNKQVQTTCTTDVRLEIIKKLGQRLNFSTLAQLDFSSFIDAIVMQSESHAKREHDKHVERNKLLGVNIIEKLKSDYDTAPQSLQLYVNDLVTHACRYLSFNVAEVNRKGPGIQTSPNLFPSFTVILPQAPEHQNFLDKLKNAFRAAYPEGVKFLLSDNKPNEIALINISNLFPLRFVELVSFLGNKYSTKINNAKDVSRVKLEIHTEDAEFPNLFVPTQKEIEEQTIPYLLLAQAMGLIIQRVTQQTGIEQFWFKPHENEEDFPPIKLGKTFVGCLKTLEDVHQEKLKQRIKELLETEYLHLEKRDTLANNMLEEVRRIKREECDNDPENEVYLRFNEGRRKAADILQQRG